VDKVYGAQCTDLVNDYLHMVWSLPPLPGNAVDFQRDPLPGWRWVDNTPTNRPPTGAIIVWNGPNAVLGLSVYGHTAIALLSDTKQLLSFDQNWPVGSPPHQQQHSYVAVAGWFQPLAPVLDHTG
jgi:hypothetical protein